MRKTVMLLMIGACVAACNNQPRVEVLDLPTIRPSEVYSLNDAKKFIVKYGNKNEKTAASYFAKGEKLEDDHLNDAIWNYKRAITLNPTYNYYSRLGKALMDNRDYHEASQLYYFLTHKYYIQDGQVEVSDFVFKEVREDDVYYYLLSSVLNDNMLWWHQLSTVADNGFDLKKMKERLFNDELFTFDPKGAVHTNIANNFITDEEAEAYASDPEHFKLFVSHIKDSSASYAIRLNTVNNFEYGGQYSWDEGGRSFTNLERGFLKQLIEHQTWLAYNVNNCARVNDSVLYVISAIDTSEHGCDKAMRHITHSITTYNNTGQIIDFKDIAWQSGAHVAEANIADNVIEIKMYDRKWRKPYNKYDPDNEVLAINMVKTVKHRVNGSGLIRIVE